MMNYALFSFQNNTHITFFDLVFVLLTNCELRLKLDIIDMITIMILIEKHL
jgi:hypothetical protein